MCYMTIKSSGYKIGSMLKISITIFFMQDLFYYVVHSFFHTLHKTDIIIAVVAQVSDVAHIPPV